MSEYSIILSKNARKSLDKLSNQLAEKLHIAILELGKDPRPHGYKKLKERTGYRIKVGNYRIIYDIHDQQLIIEVITLGHRKDVYG